MNTMAFDNAAFVTLTQEDLMAIEAGAAYLATCAASGAYIGYGLAT